MKVVLMIRGDFSLGLAGLATLLNDVCEYVQYQFLI